MPIDPSGMIDWLEQALGGVPAALLVIAFLAGPTAVWLIYRFVVQPRSKQIDVQALDLLWVCERCRSANEVRLSCCYACGLDVDDFSGELEFVMGTGVHGPAEGEGEWGAGEAARPTVLPALARGADMSRPRVAVGPGPGATAAEPTWVGSGTGAVDTASADRTAGDTEGVRDRVTPVSPR